LTKKLRQVETARNLAARFPDTPAAPPQPENLIGPRRSLSLPPPEGNPQRRPAILGASAAALRHSRFAGRLPPNLSTVSAGLVSGGWPDGRGCTIKASELHRWKRSSQQSPNARTKSAESSRSSIFLRDYKQLPVSHTRKKACSGRTSWSFCRPASCRNTILNPISLLLAAGFSLLLLARSFVYYILHA